jgi:hypothetical protein
MEQIPTQGAPFDLQGETMTQPSDQDERLPARYWLAAGTVNAALLELICNGRLPGKHASLEMRLGLQYMALQRVHLIRGLVQRQRPLAVCPSHSMDREWLAVRRLITPGENPFSWLVQADHVLRALEMALKHNDEAALFDADNHRFIITQLGPFLEEIRGRALGHSHWSALAPKTPSF